MHKNFLFACTVLIALALAPTASASPVLTEGGTALAVGSSVSAKNTGNIVFSGAGLTWECSKVTLGITLTENSGTSIKGEVKVGDANFTGTGTSEDCTSNLGSAGWTVNSALCLASVSKTDTVSITGCGTNPVVFTISVTGSGFCRYSSATLTSTYATGADATLKVTNQTVKKTEGGFFCPGEGVLNIDLDLTTTGGTTLAVS
jgi:hypothetical protein